MTEDPDGLRFTVYGLRYRKLPLCDVRGERGLTIILSYVRRSIVARSVVFIDFISCGVVSVDVDNA